MKPLHHSRSKVCMTVATAYALLVAPASGAPFVQQAPLAPAPQQDPFVQAATAATAATATAAAAPPLPARASPADARLDIEAMRRSVRDVLASEEAPSGPMGTVFAAAPAPGLQRFKGKFDEGRRPWCLTAFQGAGVLALVAMPLAALFDKKDHGCRW